MVDDTERTITTTVDIATSNNAPVQVIYEGDVEDINGDIEVERDDIVGEMRVNDAHLIIPEHELQTTMYVAFIFCL